MSLFYCELLLFIVIFTWQIEDLLGKFNEACPVDVIAYNKQLMTIIIGYNLHKF